jgi:tetratricopeptide (TPR) repeat protein
MKGWYFEPDARKSKMNLISLFISKSTQLMQHDYQKLNQEGDKALYKKNIETALNKYTQAIKIIPDDETAQEKIAEIIKGLKKDKKLDGLYAQTIAKADEAYKKQDFENARANYSFAKILKRKEKYPKDKLISIDIDAQIIYLKNRDVYDSLNFKAEELFNNKEYIKALEFYEPSLKLFPNDAFLKKRIAAINKSLKEKEPVAQPDNAIDKDKQTGKDKNK